MSAREELAQLKEAFLEMFPAEQADQPSTALLWLIPASGIGLGLVIWAVLAIAGGLS